MLGLGWGLESSILTCVLDNSDVGGVGTTLGETQTDKQQRGLWPGCLPGNQGNRSSDNFLTISERAHSSIGFLGLLHLQGCLKTPSGGIWPGKMEALGKEEEGAASWQLRGNGRI